MDELGLEQFAHGFRLLRGLFGEDQYGGMYIKPIDNDKRMEPDDYLTLIKDGKLVVSQFTTSIGIHDIEVHLMGGMLAITDITDLMKKAAELALQSDDMAKKENMTRYIDYTISGIREMWSNLSGKSNWLDYISGKIIDLIEETGVLKMSDAEARELANNQRRQLISRQAERPFIFPETLRGAGTLALVGAGQLR